MSGDDVQSDGIRAESTRDARKHCQTIPESAVYEFLSGKRQIGLAYLDAILETLDLTVSRRS
jgi:hypothetical protein